MGFTSDQIATGRQVIDAVQSLGLPPAQEQTAELDAITAALAESSLRNIDYGDYPASMGGQMSSSRGVFQQISAWGPLSDRENVAAATRMFLTGGQGGQPGLLDIKGWDQMQPRYAVQAVQQSEFDDGSNYQAQLSTAQAFIRQYGAGQPGGAGAATGVATATNAAGGSTPNPPWWMELIAPVPANALSANGIDPNNILGKIWGMLFEGAMIAAGLGLVLLGIWRMSGPARSRVRSVQV